MAHSRSSLDSPHFRLLHFEPRLRISKLGKDHVHRLRQVRRQVRPLSHFPTPPQRLLLPQRMPGKIAGTLRLVPVPYRSNSRNLDHNTFLSLSRIHQLSSNLKKGPRAHRDSPHLIYPQ